MIAIYEPTGRALEYSYLACNIYRGCIHGCDYCYVPDIMHMTPDEFHKEVKPRPGIIEAVKKDAIRYAETDMRVLLCFTSDPYPPESELTREVLKIFRALKVPFQILTKAGTAACRDFDLYSDRDAFAVTMTTMAPEMSRKHEPKAALPQDRIDALKTAKEHGIITWVSLEPVLSVEGSLSVIDKTHEFVDLYKIGTLNHKKSEIDWKDFGLQAIGLCEMLGKKYYIKEDLARRLDPRVKWNQTDNRRAPAIKKNLFE